MKTKQYNESNRDCIKGFEKFDEETIVRLLSTVRMQRYHYQIDDLPQHIGGGVRLGHQIIGEPIILINKDVYEAGRARVYVHEACHIIAQRNQLDEDPKLSAHSQFFGLLVAVCYRRMGDLSNLCLYEFSDKYGIFNGERDPDYRDDPNVQPITDDERISRFTYIIRASAWYAKTDWSIERIAAHLSRRYIREDGSYRDPAEERPKPRPLVPAWLTLTGAAGLVAGTAALAAHFGLLPALG